MKSIGNTVGLVGWRGMVGSVLMDRMQAEGDFDLIEPIFFSTSNAGGAAPAMAKNEKKLKDATDIDALKACDIIITCQGGDGLNDAPVLQQADVAIAMGQGASLAQIQADMVVQSSDLNDVYAAHMIARRTQTLIKENLLWSVLYNVIAIPLAALGMVTPIIATLGMLASSMIVVGNSLRILRYRPQLPKISPISKNP